MNHNKQYGKLSFVKDLKILSNNDSNCPVNIESENITNNCNSKVFQITIVTPHNAYYELFVAVIKDGWTIYLGKYVILSSHERWRHAGHLNVTTELGKY